MNARTCLFCGSGIEPADRFCGSCGQVTQPDEGKNAVDVAFEELRVAGEESEFIDDDPTPPRPRAVPVPWYEPTAPDPLPEQPTGSTAPAPSPAADGVVPATPATPGAGVPATPSGWYPDPRHRHQFRYWDGTQWTVIVSDGGVVANDRLGVDPTPVAPPAEGPLSAPSWYVDPVGRHQYRYWDGQRWTDRAATNQVEFTDPL